MKSKMKYLDNSVALLLLAICVGLLSCAESPQPKGEPEWFDLFDGESLEGWIPKIRGYELGTNYGETFRVEDGILRVVYDSAFYSDFQNRFGHLHYSSPFSSYILELEYRFHDKPCPGTQSWAFKNSGIMIHGQTPQSLLKNQDFPISLEAQLLGGLDSSAPRPTMNLCTPGTHVAIGNSITTEHCISSSSPTYYDDQWVPVRLEVYGDSLVRHFVHNEQVFQYHSPIIGGGVVNDFDAAVKLDGRPLTKGFISLQSEGNPVDFRNIKLKDLSPVLK